MTTPLMEISNERAWEKKIAIILMGFLFLLVGYRSSSAATATPVLNKVFVYEGGQNIRLVALFDGPLDGSDPVPQLKNGTLTLFVRGARAGKPLRQFSLGQGGYDHLEAREGKSGIWLTVRAKKGDGGLKVIPEVTLDESSLTVTLPSLSVRETSQVNPATQGAEAPYLSAEHDSTKPTPKLTNLPPRQITPESILEGALSNPSAPVSTSTAQHPDFSHGESSKKPLTLFNEKRERSNLFDRSARAGSESPQLGSEVVSLSSIVLKFAGALAGILSLIVGGMFLFKKFAPGTISRLGGHGSLVRTLYKTHLAPKQSVALVEVAGEVLVLGISGQNITMLTKIENEETLAKVRQAGESNFIDHLSKMIASHNEPPKKESQAPMVTFKKVLEENGRRDAEQTVLPEQGSAALLAYARQSAPTAKITEEGDAFPQKDFQEEREDGLSISSPRSANRLRQRLNRLPAQTGRRGMAS